VDFRILNLGEVPGPLTLQVFMGDPETNGSAISDLIPGGTIPVGDWWNGTIPIYTPGSTGLLYLVMDVDDLYPDDMVDEPVKSLLEVNYPPRWREAPSMAMLEDSEGSRIRIDDLLEDPDNRTEELMIDVAPSSNLTTRIEIGIEGELYLSCTPVQDWYGIELLTLDVSDGLSKSTVLVNVTVAPVNDPPRSVDAVQGVIELSLLEDSPFAFQIRATDIEGDSMTFNHPGGVFDLNITTGWIQWTPKQEDVGTEDHFVEIQDSGGAVSEVVLRITVIEVNDPPVVSPVPDQIAVVGIVSKVKLEVEDEEGNPITFGSSSSLIRFDPDGWMYINATPSFIGDHYIKISVSDGLNTVYIDLNLTVMEGDDGDDTGDEAVVQYILGGLGIGLAVVALLFLGLLFLRRNQAEDWVQEELEQADEMYEEDISSVEEGYDPMAEWTDE
jgi:hypothetical protein